jgi:rfaE bifunctional protein kinase chain/domain
VDYEYDAEIAGTLEAQVVTAVRMHAGGADAIVVSDYLKGVVTQGVMEAVLAVAGAGGVPVLVDPKIPHLDSYRGATLVTPNHHEAEIATHLRVRTDEDARAAARAFRTRTGCNGVLITRGDQGMWLLAPDAEGTLHAAAREVADVTGAGDTVIATLALSLAAGGTLAEAACLANEAAGIAVGRFGPATVRTAELLDAIARRAAS